jgi:hypothetical protein
MMVAYRRVVFRWLVAVGWTRFSWLVDGAAANQTLPVIVKNTNRAQTEDLRDAYSRLPIWGIHFGVQTTLGFGIVSSAISAIHWRPLL